LILKAVEREAKVPENVENVNLQLDFGKWLIIGKKVVYCGQKWGKIGWIMSR